MSKHEFKENIAVVIGINDYKNGIPALGTAKQDAEAIADILERDYHYKIHSIIDHQATKQQLETLLNIDLPNLIHTPSSRLIFYFAGHGIALNGDEGPQGYLIPQDGQLGEVATYLPMQTVEIALSKLCCRHCFVILDCCFAGAFRWSSTRRFIHIPKTIHKERYDRFIQDSAWQVITSAGYDQEALDNLDLKNDRGTTKNQVNHSPFAKALMEALQGKADIYPPSQKGKPAGDGIITATELYIYLRDSVEVPTDALKKRQTPQIWSLNKHDKGEFIFLVPGHPLNLPSAPSLDDVEENNPYRGLFSYEKKHSHLFFGRTALIKELYEFISHPQRPLAVVLGASGSGKSSLVKAGLIPYLDPLHQWKTLTPIRPGETPLTRLNSLIKELDDNSQTLHQGITNWSKNHPHQKLLLVIDQLEELVTLSRDENQIEHFSAILANLVTTHATYLKVVITLRSDFESQFSNKLLTNYWQEGRFLVPAISRNDLREVIEEPASAKVVYFQSLEDRGYLVDRLIDEVEDMPGALPLLSFALSELYLKLAHRYLEGQKTGDAVDRVITWQDYDELGGVIKSLTRRADEEYDDLVKEDAAYKKTIRHVMLRMVAIGGELARRRVYQKELVYPESEYGRVKAFIKRFDGVRLLISDQDEKGEYVEPAHDTLVNGWEKLLTWKKQEEETLILQRRLTPVAMDWDNQQKPIFLWHTNPRLDLLKKVAKSDNNWLNLVETEFVRRSVGRKTFNTRRNWSIALAVMLGLSGLTISALIGQRDALIEQVQASRESAEANLLSDRNLEALIDSLRAGNTLKKEWLLQFFKPKAVLQNQVTITLQKAVYISRERNRLDGHLGTVNSIQFSPNGEMIVSGSNDETVKLWSKDGKLLDTFEGKYESVRSISISPDGQIIAAANRDKTITLWSKDGKELTTFDVGAMGLMAHTYGANDITFSPDGQILASANVNGTITLWNREGEEITNLDEHEDFARHEGNAREVAFSPDGQIIASAGSDQTVKLLTREGKEIKTLKVHREGAEPEFGWYDQVSCTFSPDGQILVSAGEDGTIEFWNWREEKKLTTLKGHTDAINSISFSPDGQMIASASADRTIKLWSRDGKLITTLKGHTDTINSVSFSPDGQMIASASDDNTIRLWSINSQELTKFKAHNPERQWQAVQSVSFSPDSQLIVSVSPADDRDETVKLWKIDGTKLKTFETNFFSVDQVNPITFSPDGQLMTVINRSTIQLWNQKREKVTHFLEGTDLISSVIFSPDGQLITSISRDNIIKIWNRAGKEIKTLGHTNGVADDANYRQHNYITFSPNGQLIASVDNNNTNKKSEIKIWNQDGKEIKAWNGHNDDIISVIFSPDSQILASISWDLTVKLWDLEGKEIATWEWYKEDRASLATPEDILGKDSPLLNFSPDGQRIITPGEDDTFKIWDLQGNLLKNLQGENTFNGLNRISFIPNSNILASINGNTIQFWELENQQLVSDIEINSQNLLALSISPNGKLLATADENGTITVLNLELDRLLAQGCDLAQHYLENNPNIDESDRRCH